MGFNAFAVKTEKFIADNSPAILSGLAVAGAVTTAYLAGKASFRFAELSANLVDQDGSRIHLDARGKWEFLMEERLWELYIPAVGTGLATVTCIILSNRISNRRAAAVAAAYSLTERAFTQYREKIIEKMGDHREELARAEIVQDQVNLIPPNEALFEGSESALCRDAFTGRYFLCDMETLRKAQNDINYRLIHDYYVSLSDFYDLIGLEHTSMSDDVGWNVDKMLDLKFVAVMTPMGRPCISVDFTAVPIRGYDRIQ